MQGFTTCPSSLCKQKGEQDLTPGLLLLPLQAGLGVCLCLCVLWGEGKTLEALCLIGRQTYSHGTNRQDEVYVW